MFTSYLSGDSSGIPLSALTEKPLLECDLMRECNSMRRSSTRSEILTTKASSACKSGITWRSMGRRTPGLGKASTGEAPSHGLPEFSGRRSV